MFSVSIDSWFSVFCFLQKYSNVAYERIFLLIMKIKKYLGWVRCFVLEISGL